MIFAEEITLESFRILPQTWQVCKLSINLPGLAGLWTVYKPAMFWGRILKDSSDQGQFKTFSSVYFHRTGICSREARAPKNVQG